MTGVDTSLVDKKALSLPDQSSVPLVLSFVEDDDKSKSVVDGNHIIMHNMVMQQVVFRASDALDYNADLAAHEDSDSSNDRPVRKSLGHVDLAEQKKSSKTSMTKTKKSSRRGVRQADAQSRCSPSPQGVHQEGAAVRRNHAAVARRNAVAHPAIPWVRAQYRYKYWCHTNIRKGQ
jgi:hypothetical protein